MSARSHSIHPAAIASVAGALLTLILHFVISPQAALIAALGGFGATLFFSLIDHSVTSSASANLQKIETFLQELRTIPALSPQVRVEFNSQSAALQGLLRQLPEEQRAQVVAFLDRATRRIRDAEAHVTQPTQLPTPKAAPTVTPQASPSSATSAPVTAPLATAGAQSSGIRIDAILIDDEESVHMAWKVAAGRAGKTVLTFKSVDDILALPGLSKIPVDTRIIVDAHLGHGTKGVVAAKALFDKGFKNLALAHPEPRKIMEPMPTWIQQVTDKRPQFV